MLKEVLGKIVTAVKWQMMGIPKEQYIMVIILIVGLVLCTYGIKQVGIIEERKLRKIRAIILFLGYSILVSFITLLRRIPGVQTNYYLIPFQNYLDSYGGINEKAILYSFLNIVLFIPYGMILSRITAEHRKNRRMIVIIGLFLSCFIEITQLFTRRGTFETEDLILNTTGAFVGTLLDEWLIKCQYWYMKRWRKKGFLVQQKSRNEKSR